MSWGIDPELQAMFYGELDERAARLSEGAAELQTGPVASDRAGAMMREAHTIKGTGRVLGFDAIAHVGELFEELWRGLQGGELELSHEAVGAMAAVTALLPAAGRGDAATGTPELVEAFNALVAVTPLEYAPLAPAVESTAEPEAPEVAPAATPPAGVPEAGPAATEAPAAEAEPEPGPEPERESVPQPQPEEPSESMDDWGPGGDAEPADPRPAITFESPLQDPSPPVPGVAPEPDEPQEPEVPTAEQSPDYEPVATREELQALPVASEGFGVAGEETGPQTDHGDLPQDGAASEEPVSPDAASTESDPRHYRVDLAGLMSAVEHWARNESVMVNAGRLHEFLNQVAALRRDAAASLADVALAAADGGDQHDTAHFLDLIARIEGEAESLQTNVLALASVPLSGLTAQLPQLVAYLAKKLSRSVDLEIEGDEHIAVDKQVLDAIGDPIRQIVVNAIHHGIEPASTREEAGKSPTGTVKVRFELDAGTLNVVVSDDGMGVDWDAVRSVAANDGRIDPNAATDPNQLNEMLFEPGFTTGTDADFGGGGKGLSTVRTVAESLFGSVALETVPGTGTTVTLAVPAYRALQNVLLVVAGGMEWGVPNAAVDAVLQLGDFEVEEDGGWKWITWEQQRLPVVSLAASVGLKEAEGGDTQLVVLSHSLGSVALAVSTVGGVRELVVKELGRIVTGPRHILGVAFVAGDMVLVADAGKLIERSQKAAEDKPPSARVLVVDDSRGARAVVSGALASSGFLTSVAGSVAEALEVLDEISVDALVVDFSMPQADGVALVEEVRRRGNLVPIIMLSGAANEDDKQRSLDAGADAFLEKADFREGVLANALWEMLDT